jgi:hypothetical protein
MATPRNPSTPAWSTRSPPRVEIPSCPYSANRTTETASAGGGRCSTLTPTFCPFSLGDEADHLEVRPVSVAVSRRCRRRHRRKHDQSSRTRGASARSARVQHDLPRQKATRPAAARHAATTRQQDHPESRHHPWTTGPPRFDGHYEVWAFVAETTTMQLVGSLEPGHVAELPVPTGVDITRFTGIDIFAEPYDGDPAHSGRSILRGQLAR